ncbi:MULTISPECIES: hypothetical protein [unclassified Methanothermobacter]|nr:MULTISPECIES: hypothetical protein [unclassified Methanothermobacter]
MKGNLKNLVLYLAASFCNLNVTAGAPEQRPLWAMPPGRTEDIQ